MSSIPFHWHLSFYKFNAAAIIFKKNILARGAAHPNEYLLIQIWKIFGIFCSIDSRFTDNMWRWLSLVRFLCKLKRMDCFENWLLHRMWFNFVWRVFFSLLILILMSASDRTHRTTLCAFSAKGRIEKSSLLTKKNGCENIFHCHWA